MKSKINIYQDIMKKKYWNIKQVAFDYIDQSSSWFLKWMYFFTWYLRGPAAAIQMPMLTSSPCKNTFTCWKTS